MLREGGASHADAVDALVVGTGLDRQTVRARLMRASRAGVVTRQKQATSEVNAGV
jgi:DNA-binding transcriptional regulator PaaX